jgi:hypothetical protein
VLACGLLHVVAAASHRGRSVPEVELITEPRPGEEYVLFRSAVQPQQVQHARSLNDELEVHTEVSVVTSKNVQVGSVTVRPAAAAGVRVQPADAEEARAMARKMEHKSHQHPQAVATENHNVEVKPEAESGLVKTPVLKNEQGEISVPAGKFQSRYGDHDF